MIPGIWLLFHYADNFHSYKCPDNKEKLLTEEANERGKESQILYMLSSKLSDAADMEAVSRIKRESISHLLPGKMSDAFMLEGSPEPIFIQQSGKSRFTEACRMQMRFGRDIQIFEPRYLEEEDTYGYPVQRTGAFAGSC